MAVAPDTAADLVNRIFDLQRVVRCVAAASFRWQDTGVALQGVLRVRGGAGVPRHPPGGAARRQRPRPQPSYRGPGRYGTDPDETLGILKHSARAHSVPALPAQTLQEH